VAAEEALQGELLRCLCIALHRNRVGSLKRAAIVLDPDEETPPRKSPKSELRPQISDEEWRSSDVAVAKH
jgi:hypothetical protein